MKIKTQNLNVKTFGVIVGVVLMAAVGFSSIVAAAPTGLKEEIDDLNSQVKAREQSVKDLDSSIQAYKKKIAQNEDAVASLQNEVALLENRIQEKQLAVRRTSGEIEIVNLKIESLTRQIEIQKQTLGRRQAALGELVRRIQEAEQVSLFDILITHPSLSDFFARLEELKRIQGDLGNATKEVRQTQKDLQDQEKQVEAQRVALHAEQDQLKKEQAELEGDRSAKVSLVGETKNKESEFQRMLYELRQEQQSTADAIADLQNSLKDKLDSIDEALARGDILLSWPMRPVRGISAHFHDASYPFRRLFEHPGTDIPTPVGTPVRAAAGGYVAWNKLGKQYGNYTMIVHPGGIATVYAHLSRFGVKPDTYVDRGDVIGYSGGRPGDQGAGLSTGPHLHFEVRQNGIPVNAEQFLPSI